MKFIGPFAFFYLENISNTKNLKIGVWRKQKKRINRNIKMHEQQNKINIIMIKKLHNIQFLFKNINRISRKNR